MHMSNRFLQICTEIVYYVNMNIISAMGNESWDIFVPGKMDGSREEIEISPFGKNGRQQV